jgi:transcriptional regulator with XRE-family HTH domain
MNERERLLEIMKSQNLNSKQLSMELGVSAGTISNILGGRNKPSLEVMQNICNRYPFISPTWLFLGFGEMYIDGYDPETMDCVPDLFSPAVHSQQDPVIMKESVGVSDSVCASVRKIEKIVIFYSDGTFEER